MAYRAFEHARFRVRGGCARPPRFFKPHAVQASERATMDGHRSLTPGQTTFINKTPSLPPASTDPRVALEFS